MNKRKPNEQGVSVLTPEDYSKFVHSINTPSSRVQVNGKLKESFKKYKAEQDETKR